MPVFHLGPFEVHQPLAKGGMGLVWSGWHRAEKVPVAVKVMTGKRARDPGFRQAFATEARAVARLDHPNVVMLFDYGVVSPEASAASGHTIAAGSPFMVMERAATSLQTAYFPRSWLELAELLFALLDALAHAHAHGVIHRDIKPGNILLMSPGPPYGTARLTDFGIARAFEISEAGAESRTDRLGTPQYMAPEHVLGNWRQQGPWTDLYALGCVAYRLFNARPMFDATNPDQIMACQLAKAPEPLTPQYAIPPGFSAWLWRLLAKHPAARFTHAADARHALQQIVAAHRDGPGERVAAAKHVTSRLEPLTSETLSEAATISTRAPHATAPAFLHSPVPLAPPVREDWRRPGRAPRSQQLVGAGLGLFGLRAIPMTARETERDLLWSGLRHVHKSGSAQVIVLRGGAGAGKSRLVEWLAQQAREDGAATLLVATHAAFPGPMDGVGAMVARHFNAAELAHDELLEHLKAVRNAWTPGSREEELHELVEVISPAAVERPARVRFSSPHERFLVIRRLLARLAGLRPLLMWLDDVQFGSEALSLVDDLLDEQARGPYPILVIMTVRDEELSERSIEAVQLDLLLERDEVLPLELEPLGADEHAELVRHLLLLDDALTDQVRQRTAGNPLFAVQLLADWVQRGVLRSTATGFVLADGASASIPDDLWQLWLARIERVTSLVSPDPSQRAAAGEALEVAAALGQRVDAREWIQVCKEADLAPSPRLMDEILAARLVIADGLGWSFVHAMLRESLTRVAIEGGRWERAHGACADMLERRYGLDRPGVAERVAQHKLAAGDIEGALEPLQKAARERRGLGEIEHTMALEEAVLEALVELQVGQDDPRWPASYARMAQTLAIRGDLEQAEGFTHRALALLEPGGEAAVRARVARVRGVIADKRGDTLSAIVHFSEAVAIARVGDERTALAHAMYGLAEAQKRSTAFADAEQTYALARDCFADIGDDLGIGEALVGLAAIARGRGELPRATALLAEALPKLERSGNRLSITVATNALGDLERRQGALDAALSHYLRALDQLEAMGSKATVYIETNIILTFLARGEIERAQQTVAHCLAELRASGQTGPEPIVAAAAMVCAAVRSDWAMWDVHSARLTELLAGTTAVEPDIAWALERAGMVAADRGESARARSGLLAALAQREGLGDVDAAAALRAALGQLL